MQQRWRRLSRIGTLISLSAILILMEDGAAIKTTRRAATVAERDETVAGLMSERDQARAELKAAFIDIDAARIQHNRLAAGVVERDRTIAALTGERDSMTARAAAAEIRTAVAEAIAAERAEHIRTLLRSLSALESSSGTGPDPFTD